MKIRSAWHSSAVRAATLFAALISIVVSTLFIAVYFEIREELYEQLQIRTQAIHDTFLEFSEAAAPESLARAVQGRSEAFQSGGGIILLLDSDSRFIAGNIEGYRDFPGWEFIRPDELNASERFEFDERFLARWSHLPSGEHLLFGLSDDSIEEAREAIVLGIVLAICAAVLVTVLVSAWLAVRNRRRVNSIGLTLEEFGRGSLASRVSLTGENDDLDQVASRVNDMLDEVETLVESLRQISTDIAHDLKTPIGRLRQRLDTAANDAKSVSEFRSSIEESIEQVDQIVETFEALLRIAQIESGKRRANFSAVRLSHLLSDLSEIYGAVAEDSGHAFASNIDLGTHSVFGDSSLLIQLFANLIENSIRHCPPGGRIHIGTEILPDGVRVSVSDTGPGIPEDERAKVWRRLYRLEKSRTTDGTGLGLSLVKAIADLHGADLEMDDNQPGLIVRVTFPMSVVDTSTSE